MRLIHIFLILSINSLLAGEIISTNDFGLIEKEADRLDKNSLILFDVDATLILPNDAILKPQGKDLFNRLIATYTDRDLFREIRMKADHSLVDDRSLSFVQKLKQNNIPIIAFTAAPSKVRGVEELGVWRVNELQKYGFDFSSAFPNSNFFELSKNANQQYVPLFKSGVLYSSFHSKGDILVLFLQYLNLVPKKVIFVDDEFEHVQSVVASMNQQGVPCTGIHYTAANEVPCDLDVEQAIFQINHFIEYDIWLGDKESKQLLEGCKHANN